MTIPSLPWHLRFNGHFHDIGIGPGHYSPAFIAIHQNEHIGVHATEARQIAEYVTEAVNNYSELKAEVERLRIQVDVERRKHAKQV
jgi:hypothetical protein